MLDLVALPSGYSERKPHELSGGQRQRVVIARALITEPEFIVADEPVSALDVSVQAQIVALLKQLKNDLGLSILFISHDLAIMEYLSDRIAVLYLGQIMEIASSSSICNRPHHPYTKALISAVPRVNKSQRENWRPLTGELPNPVDPPSGCVFRTRCAFAIPKCSGAASLRRVGLDHLSACIRDDIIS
jgi:oligopeptide/dipeptide ABC transporter ATP-binding protein